MTSVEVVDAVLRSARVVVPDYQLSLAIGKEGQNARLAARLTGWRIDIRSDAAEQAAAAARDAEAAVVARPRAGRARGGGAPREVIARRRGALDSQSARREGPERTCVGCRGRAAKATLLRVVGSEASSSPILPAACRVEVPPCTATCSASPSPRSGGRSPGPCAWTVRST